MTTHGGSHSATRKRLPLLLVAIVTVAAATVGLATPAGANHRTGVTVARGLAYNYYTNVSLFGGPTSVRGYGQVVCTAPNTPSGCVPANSGDPYNQPASGSASPSVECPASGGVASVTDPDGARGTYGPAAIFSGKWPDSHPQAPPSGPLTSTVDCRRGVNGQVTASTAAVLMPTGSAYPGGVGPGPFIADEVRSTCTVKRDGTRTASTTIVNGILETKYDASTQLPTQTEPVPQSPTVNYTRTGTIDHVGDSYRIVFNEQTTRPDGSITVVAAHMYLLGPTAVGDMVIGHSTCGPLTTGPFRHSKIADFDGDNDTDRSVFRNGTWFAEGQSPAFLGAANDIPVPGDYDGDGDADRAVYRGGTWFTEGQANAFLGLANDIPVPGDYDGDGDTDRAVFRPSVGAWFIEGQATVYHGATNDIPVPGDYDGDGDTDKAIWRPSVGGWYIAGQTTQFMGLNGDIPVPGDYDGDGDTDVGIWRPQVGGWYIAGQTTQFIGLQGDVPVPGDYDGNGTTDRAIWRPSSGGWHVQNQATAYLGVNGDVPLPLPAAIYRTFF